MTAKPGLRTPLLAGAIVMAMAGAATAQAGCGYHSVSLEAKTALQSTPQLESEAALDQTITQLEPEAALDEATTQPVPETALDEAMMQPEPEAAVEDTETQIEPVAARDEIAPRVAHADVTPRPKPAIPIILGTYR